MLANRTGISIAKSETGQRARLGTVLNVRDLPGLVEGVRHPKLSIMHGDQTTSVFTQLTINDAVRSCAVAPIEARGTFLGVVVAGYPEAQTNEALEDREATLLPLLSGLADLAATALDNAALVARMKDQALHDTLTGLPNRTLVEDRASQALLRRRRVGGEVSLLFVDLDRFKNVNDTFGHEAGDDLLEQVATRLSSSLRSSDTVARVGGDEFVVLLPDTAHGRDVERVVDQLLAQLERPFRVSGREVSISASIGIASAPDDGDSYVELVRHADAAMYRVKEAGGDGCAIHSPTVAADRGLRLGGQVRRRSRGSATPGGV